mgnify:CR=1 FL=1
MDTGVPLAAVPAIFKVMLSSAKPFRDMLMVASSCYFNLNEKRLMLLPVLLCFRRCELSGGRICLCFAEHGF